MKKKLDYVTNSSSTSFCAWGISIDSCFESLPETVKMMIYKQYVEYRKECDSEYLSYEEFSDGVEGEDWTWFVDEVFEKINLTGTVFCGGGVTYIGISPDQIPENKTILEAKNETKQKLQELGFSVDKFEYILESWRD